MSMKRARSSTNRFSLIDARRSKYHYNTLLYMQQIEPTRYEIDPDADVLKG